MQQPFGQLPSAAFRRGNPRRFLHPHQGGKAARHHFTPVFHIAAIMVWLVALAFLVLGAQDLNLVTAHPNWGIGGHLAQRYAAGIDRAEAPLDVGGAAADAGQGVVVAGRNRVEFVVVAAGTAQGNAEKVLPQNVNLFVDHIELALFRVAVGGDDVEQCQVAGGDQVIGFFFRRGGRQEVSGELLTDEPEVLALVGWRVFACLGCLRSRIGRADLDPVEKVRGPDDVATFEAATGQDDELRRPVVVPLAAALWPGGPAHRAQ